MDNSILERQIQNALTRMAEETHVDSRTTNRIQTNVFASVEEVKTMKKMNWKRTMIAAAAICVLGTMTAVAMGQAAMIFGSSDERAVITEFAEAKQIQKELDSAVKVMEAFSNGYEFSEAVPMEKVYQDAEGNPILEETVLNFVYEKEGSGDLTFSADRMALGNVEAEEAVTLENGVTIYYRTQVNKYVPADYVMTEEELKLSNEGALNVAYGSQEIELVTSVHTAWEQDGIAYSLMAFDETLSAGDMFQMAAEIVQ